MSVDPTDRFRQVMSEPLVEVSLGEREASIRTDPTKGWLWMLHTIPGSQSISRIRDPKHLRYASEYAGGARYLAGHLPFDEVVEIEVPGVELSASAIGNGMWLAIVLSADAAMVCFLDSDRNVVHKYPVEAVPSPRPVRWYDRIISLFSIPRRRRTFRSK